MMLVRVLVTRGVIVWNAAHRLAPGSISICFAVPVGWARHFAAALAPATSDGWIASPVWLPQLLRS